MKLKHFIKRFSFEINPSIGFMISVFLNTRHDADTLNEFEISIMCFTLYYYF